MEGLDLGGRCLGGCLGEGEVELTATAEVVVVVVAVVEGMGRWAVGLMPQAVDG